jgi:DNA-binding transcriptional ArsR family regulator
MQTTKTTDPQPSAATAPAQLASNDCLHIESCACCNPEDNCPIDTMPEEEILYDLADLFKVFADTTRIKILYALMAEPRCVADIAEMIGATQSAVSHQLRTLKQAHLVKFQRDGKNVFYSLSDNHVFSILCQGLTHICE